MKHRFPIRLLVVDRGPAEAAALVAALRRAGYRISPKLVGSVDAVTDAVRRQRWDLVLAADGLSDAPLADVAEAVNRRGDLPVVVLEDPERNTREARVTALRLGVRDVVPRGEPEMLEQTVRRELDSLDHRRRLRRHARLAGDSRDALRWLVGSARDPLAVVRRGDLLFANQSFLDLFGLGPMEGVLRGGLFECIDVPEREEFRALLEDLWAGEDRPIEIDLRGFHRISGAFDLRLDIAPIAFEGQRGHRIVAVALDAASAQAPEAEDEREPATERDARAPGPAATRPALAVVASRDEPGEPGAAAPTPTDVDDEAGPAAATAGSENETGPVAAAAGSEDDPGLLDRDRLLALVASRAAALDDESYLGLVYVEIDNYADLKNHLGLDRLDALVDEIVSRLREKLPDGAIVARAADDDFVALLDGLGQAEAAKVHRAVEQQVGGMMIEVGGRTVLVSAGAGLAGVQPRDANAPERALRRAFKACQSESRTSTSTRTANGEPVDDERDESAMEDIARDLEAGMHDGRLFLVYQPIVRLRGEPMELYEAFMRFRNSQGEMVPPREFLDVADRTGLRQAIDRWLVETALDALAEQQAQGHATRLFIKLSGQATRDIEIPLAIGRGLKENRLTPDRLTVELSESTANAQMRATRAFMHAIRGFQCRTALEHFGISRRPFRLLEHVPVDYLTVDSSVANAISADRRALARMNDIATRARALEKLTIAEYVEDARSVALLYETGIEFVQGYYIQRPCERMDFEFSLAV